VLAPPPWPFTLPKIEATCPQRGNPQEAGKLMPPKYSGYLFGTITKPPWCVKETKFSCKVFVAIKLGKCISVNKMTLTEVGFNVQLKGKLTKKRYRYAPVFVKHFSHLQFTHLHINNLSANTVTTKCTFKQYTAEHSINIKH
jgi:hypothetical protein